MLFAFALADVVLVRDYFRVEEGRERAADFVVFGRFMRVFLEKWVVQRGFVVVKTW